MKEITREDLINNTIQDLGLDHSAYNILSPEVLAALIRRSAGWTCPGTHRSLIDSVTSSLKGLVDDDSGNYGLVSQTVQSMVALGDLTEYSGEEDGFTSKGTLLYSSPPSFIRRANGNIMLMGISPDHISPFPSDIEEQIEYIGHTRIIPNRAVVADPKLLDGLSEIPEDTWLKAPIEEASYSLIDRISDLLRTAGPSGSIPDLQIIDPQKPVRYYTGRRIKALNQTGKFVARRPQSYGSPLWCYVEIESGEPLRFIDFPIGPQGSKGNDEAWRLQAAIDHQRGFPQQMLVTQGNNESSGIIRLFSPIPSWMERRWTIIGKRSRSGWLSFEIPTTELTQEIEFARKKMWLEEIY